MTDKPSAIAEPLYTDFRFEDPLLVECFEETLDDLVLSCPIAHGRQGKGFHVINRYADVRRCAMDWQTFSSADGWQLNPPDGNIPILPEDSDPPYHNNWRAVLNPYFAARNVGKLEDFARRRAGELIDGFALTPGTKPNYESGYMRTIRNVMLSWGTAKKWGGSAKRNPPCQCRRRMSAVI